MKKCPHCGMNIRDNVDVCGYCGGEIAPQRTASPGMKGSQGMQKNAPSRQAQKRPAPAPADETENGEEEEGGLSKILQPGEQVLIGSLNVSVKKFFFHAYLTNKRIFLIDTQEKKLKVTAKDIPRETISDCTVEYAENADPVLVLSVKSDADDEVKTMKLVFTQNGADRTGEIEDWIALLGREPEAKPPKRQAPAPKSPEPETVDMPEEEPEEEERLPPRPAKTPVRTEELHPARKTLKEHERQPPVKRLIPLSREPAPGPEREPQVQPQAQRRVQIKAVQEPEQPRETVVRAAPAPAKSMTSPVRRPEVQSAMRTAVNSPVQPVRPTQVYPAKSMTSEPVRRPLPEVSRQNVPEERPVVRKAVLPEEPADAPQFCHNCGKKLPGEANFCPGCGTRLGRSRTDPAARASKTIPRPASTATPPAPAQRRIPKIEEIREDEEAEEQQRRPPVKKTPKGSDMTILQKFLRR